MSRKSPLPPLKDDWMITSKLWKPSLINARKWESINEELIQLLSNQIFQIVSPSTNLVRFITLMPANKQSNGFTNTKPIPNTTSNRNPNPNLTLLQVCF
jgi:hypothetical protein